MDGFNCKMCGNIGCYESQQDAEILFSEIWQARYKEREKNFFYERRWEGTNQKSSQGNCLEYIPIQNTIECAAWLVNRIEKGILYDE